VLAILCRRAYGLLVVTKGCGRANLCMNGYGDSANKVAAKMGFFEGHDCLGVGMCLAVSMRRSLATTRVTGEGQTVKHWAPLEGQ
jgi:hypothetical protein